MVAAVVCEPWSAQRSALEPGMPPEPAVRTGGEPAWAGVRAADRAPGSCACRRGAAAGAGTRGQRVAAVDGVVRTEALLAAAAEGGPAICIGHVECANGLRASVEERGANKERRSFVATASQSAGVFPVDVKRMKIDALCATA